MASVIYAPPIRSSYPVPPPRSPQPPQKRRLSGPPVHGSSCGDRIRSSEPLPLVCDRASACDFCHRSPFLSLHILQMQFNLTREGLIRMFCYQCEQTSKGEVCQAVGVCGKDETSAVLQDLLIYAAKGISMYAHRA